MININDQYQCLGKCPPTPPLRDLCVMIARHNAEQESAVLLIPQFLKLGRISVSGQVPTYPFPNSTTVN